MKLEFIKIDKIQTNPKNPRGINIEEEDTKLATLKDSIDQFGILVPLVVLNKNGNYLLIDGERRYWAAKSLGITTVPAYVSDKKLDSEEIFIRMFHIHHNVEQWPPIPQCRALEPYYNEFLKEPIIRKLKSDDQKINLIARKLAELSGIERQNAVNRILFLRWPDDIKSKVYKHPKQGAYLYMCEIEQGIILPALKNYPEYFEKVLVNDVRRFLLEKLDTGAVSKKINVRNATPILMYKSHDPKEKEKVLEIFDELVKDKNMTYQDAMETFSRGFPHADAEESPTPRKLLNSMNRLSKQIELFDPKSFSNARAGSNAEKEEISETIEILIDSLRNLYDLLGKVELENEQPLK